MEGEDFTGAGLDYTDGFFVNKECVISRANICLVLANSNADACAEIDGLFVLNNPTGLGQTLIDQIARNSVRDFSSASS
jgi:hypothetical protein